MSEHPFDGPQSVAPGDCVRLRPSSAHAGRGLCEVHSVTTEGVVVRMEGREHLVDFAHVGAVLKKSKAPGPNDGPE